ncbi:MAG TPA: hypothetical protein VIG99_05810 [Myxococcaceae bacterium]|jgi:hypothetical protein
MSEKQQIFGAFLETPQKQRWSLPATLLGIALTVVGVRLVTHREGTNIVTPRGIQTVHTGMTKPEVNQLLGRPFAFAEAHDGLDCYRYGYPNLENPSFVVYSLCYEEAHLRDISQQRYTTWTVSEDGSRMTPAGQ